MVSFTERQRAALIRILAHELVWQQSTVDRRREANFMAEKLVDSLDGTQAESMALRRAIPKIAANVEQSA